MIEITPHISLDEDELEVTFIRASGPGGQNVNKVSTAVQMRFDARRSPSLPNDVAVRLQKQAGSKLTHDGVIVITANRHRTQEANRRDAVQRLVDMIAQAAEPPKKRVPTKPSRSAKEKRLASKARRGEVKSMRSKPITRD